MKSAEELVMERLTSQPTGWPREPLRRNLTVEEKFRYGVPVSASDVETLAEGMAEDMERERWDEAFAEGEETGREKAFQEILEKLNG
jgi:hypothetical protein